MIPGDGGANAIRRWRRQKSRIAAILGFILDKIYAVIEEDLSLILASLT